MMWLTFVVLLIGFIAGYMIGTGRRVSLKTNPVTITSEINEGSIASDGSSGYNTQPNNIKQSSVGVGDKWQYDDPNQWAQSMYLSSSHLPGLPSTLDIQAENIRSTLK